MRRTKLSDKTSRLRHANRRSGETAYDAAAVNRFTKSHFASAGATDLNSAIHANRAELVKRCSYEFRNNCYAKGIVNSFVNEIVGTGPTLQLTTKNSRFNSSTEQRFGEYMAICDAGGDPEVGERMDMAEHFRVGVKEICVRGEEITNFSTDDDGEPGEPQLRLQAVSADRLASNAINPAKGITDGIKLNAKTGKPEAYVLYDHNPNSSLFSPTLKTSDIPARDIIHVYIQDEAGQIRGAPLLAPCLPLLAYLRRLTLAVVSSAEQAANISAIMKTQLGAVPPEVVASMDELEIPRNAMLTLPEGYDIEQMKAEQPTAQYPKFKLELVAEIGRAMMMPYIVSGGNAQGYNYSSGRLDLQDWWKAVAVIQSLLARRKGDRIFNRWFAEARLIPGYIQGYTAKMRQTPIHRITRQWNWPGHEHVDPLKEAKAEETRLANLSTTHAEIWARKGKDWERAYEQIAREKKFKQDLEKKYGVTLTDEDVTPAEPAPSTTGKTNAN